MTRAAARFALAGTRPLLTRIPLYSGPLAAVRPDRPPWPGETLRHGGTALHVRWTPGPEQAERIVYLHGLGGSSTNFTDLAGLVGSQLGGMALDLPGFGLSAPPPGFDYAPDSHAEVTAAFLAGLCPEPVHLVGNSMGGAVALLIAARHPQLVRTLTLLAPAMPDLRIDPRRLSDPRIALTLLPVVGGRVRRLLAAASPEERAERIVRLCFADPSAVCMSRRAAAVAELAAWTGQEWAGAALNESTEQLVRSWLVPNSRSLWRVAAAVRVPALVIWGAADRVVSVRKAPRTAVALPRGRLFVLPRTGHMPQIERPSSVARAILGMVNTVNHYRW
ncbi:MAG TPA: alpha/beta fold hydrolase [Pseudonocardiaceae bacterium]|nr:alpha/beta fold hydrolase [Pseudonocardiaceae bacterium]